MKKLYQNIEKSQGLGGAMMDLYETPILLKGYHPDYNPESDYKTAKQPVPSSTGYTALDYKPPSPDEIREHLAVNGWIGHRVPEGCHILDVEDSETIVEIKAICQRHAIDPPVNRTNNGVQFVFSLNLRLGSVGPYLAFFG